MGRNRLLRSLSFLFVLSVGLAGCSIGEESMEQDTNRGAISSEVYEESTEGIDVTPSAEIVELENGLSVVRHDGDDGFDGFLSRMRVFGRRGCCLSGGKSVIRS